MADPIAAVTDAGDATPFRLTALAHGGGCGCKIGPALLRELLSDSCFGFQHADLLVGATSSDDAAVYRINEHQAVIATTDFFMPIVDDPFEFGRIAATNALSDVYAMGGSPILALAIVGMPVGRMPSSVMRLIIEGGAETAQTLLEERFDYVFFTGGVATGKLVMAAAAKHLTPVTLELGGKNACIVDADAPLDIAARRIVFGKFFNAGQSCVAVDYVLADRRIKQALLSHILKYIIEFYGEDASRSPDFARIVNEPHFDRLLGLLHAGDIIIGGNTNRASRYIAPTVIDGITGSEPIMEDEIFGPLLPVIVYDDLSEAIEFVNGRPSALALYFFSRNRERQERVLAGTTSGGGCINDTVIHETVTGLPFGGVGDSGMGKYHGKASFDTFTHERSIVRNSFLIDVFLRYPPYKDHLKFLRRLF